MQTLQTTSLRVSENQLFILDQQALPQETRWLAADNFDAQGQQRQRLQDLREHD